MSDIQKKLVLLYGFSSDVNAYMAERILEKKHDFSCFIMLYFNVPEITRAFSNGYETIYVDAERGDSPSNAFVEQEARKNYEWTGVEVEAIHLPFTPLNIH